MKEASGILMTTTMTQRSSSSASSRAMTIALERRKRASECSIQKSRIRKAGSKRGLSENRFGCGRSLLPLVLIIERYKNSEAVALVLYFLTKAKISIKVMWEEINYDFDRRVMWRGGEANLIDGWSSSSTPRFAMFISFFIFFLD